MNSTLITTISWRKYEEFYSKTGIQPAMADLDEQAAIFQLRDKAKGPLYSLFFNNSFLFSEEILRNNYFALLCLLAGEGLGPTTMSSNELNIRYGEIFDLHYANLKTTEKYRTIFLLPYAAADYEWPDYFKCHVDSIRNASVAKAQKAGHSNTNLDYHQRVNFGSVIHDKCKAMKQEINNYVNNNWIASSLWPSGKSKSAFLFYLRKSYYQNRDFQIKAKDAVYNQYLRSQNRRKSEGLDVVKWKVEDHVEEINAKRLEYDFKDGKECYPQFWLAFVYLGIPCDEPLPSLISGIAQKKKKSRKLNK
jgi:hypothetical protein